MPQPRDADHRLTTNRPADVTRVGWDEVIDDLTYFR
jgi:hypothetical protein